METTENIEIERGEGFINAEGNNGMSYASANQAFYAYLDATGQKKTKATKAQFKGWLAKQKESGTLGKLVAAGKDKVKTAIDSKIAQKQGQSQQSTGPIMDQVTEPEQKMKVNIPMGVKIGIAIAAIGLISWGIYAVVKKNKKAA